MNPESKLSGFVRSIAGVMGSNPSDFFLRRSLSRVKYYVVMVARYCGKAVGGETYERQNRIRKLLLSLFFFSYLFQSPSTSGFHSNATVLLETDYLEFGAWSDGPFHIRTS